MTPAQQLRSLLALLPGAQEAQAAALGVAYQRLRHWLLRASYDDSGRAWTRREAPPAEDVIAQARELVAAHAARCDRATLDAV